MARPVFRVPWHLRAEKLSDAVMARIPEYDSKSQEELQAYIAEARGRVQATTDPHAALDKELVDVFAIVCVASRRTVGLDPYKVQIMSGICLHEGSIIEQKTGEGKSLTCAFPAILDALVGKGVHVVTVNPYLTKRDADNIGRIGRYLGLTVDYVIADKSPVQKKAAYGCDITYVSNTELGFDYLRDNMATRSSAVMQRGLEYAIVDEVDSILIDEARTPLIVAGEGTSVDALYRRANNLVESMEQGTESREFNRGEAYRGIEREETGDYIVHEKRKNVILTEAGVEKVEAAFGLDNYSDEANRSIQHAVEQCLYAHALMKRDKDYIVRKGKVELVDEFTGRIAEGRQYSDGLHQAIEAKEHVTVSPVNETIATVTYQNFFRKYKHLCGMTGTAATERREFKTTYGLAVRVIETNKPMIRDDMPDKLYLRKSNKWTAVANEVESAIAKGRPVLIGTASVEESESMAEVLKQRGIAYQLLNARQDAHEAELVAKAGIHGTVTVATNMAGRGTDIILDDEARAAGGLYVIGTEKNEAERIDNQLRGRAGRQGDPGTSVFYCSCEDRVMRLYGSDRFKKTLENSEYDNGEEITMKSVMAAIKSTQKHVEADNFAIRQDTLEYDDVNDMQRERIYAERRAILAREDVEPAVISSIKSTITRMCEVVDKPEFALSAFESQTGLKVLDGEGDMKQRLIDTALGALNTMKFVTADARASYMRKSLLIAIDSAWSEQLKALEFCRDAVSYSGYGQLDPKAVYAHEAWKLYEKMQNNIYSATLYTVFARAQDTKGKLMTEDGKLVLVSSKDMGV